jgi:hypothetical protein
MTAKQEESRFLADRYRQAAFDLLRAAKVLHDTAEALRASKQRVSGTAITDLGAAIDLLDKMVSVASADRAKT